MRFGTIVNLPPKNERYASGMNSPGKRGAVRARATKASLLQTGTVDARRFEEMKVRADNLMSLAREMNSSLGLPVFVDTFLTRCCAMLQAQSAILALAQGSLLEVVAAHGSASAEQKGNLRGLNLT